MELDEGETSQEVTITLMEPACKQSALSRILDDEPEHAVSVKTTIAEKVNNEFDIYMQMPVANTDQSPLDWWKKEDLQFPLLSKLARKYLCICATSITSERVFSTAGYINSNLRSCLKPEKIHQLTFLSRNSSCVYLHVLITVF